MSDKRPQFLVCPANDWLSAAEAARAINSLRDWQEFGGVLVLEFPAKVYECRDGVWTLLPEGLVGSPSAPLAALDRLAVELGTDQFYYHINCGGQILQRVLAGFECRKCGITADGFEVVNQ
jgi:hypothetical protein